MSSGGDQLDLEPLTVLQVCRVVIRPARMGVPVGEQQLPAMPLCGLDDGIDLVPGPRVEG